MEKCKDCIHRTFFEMGEYEYVTYCDNFGEEIETIDEFHKDCVGKFISKSSIKKNIKHFEQEIKKLMTNLNNANVEEIQKKEVIFMIEIIKLYKKLEVETL